MRARKNAIGYRISCGDGRGPYAHLRIEIMMGRIVDAAKEYDRQGDAYYLERLQKIREDGDSTKYFHPSNRGKFELRWQTDADKVERDNGEVWYACSIENADFSPDVAALIGKLARKLCSDGYSDCWSKQPAEVLMRLHEMGAIKVEYSADVYDAWTIRGEATCADIASPYEAKENSETERATD